LFRRGEESGLLGDVAESASQPGVTPVVTPHRAHHQNPMVKHGHVQGDQIGTFYGYFVFLWPFGIFVTIWNISPHFGKLYLEKSGNLVLFDESKSF
jgi:hypothetical protein